MYLEIDEGFDEHPKTVRLCRVIGDQNAGQYLLRLWSWACRSAQDGDISGLEAGDVERICRYSPADGKLYEALTSIWSHKFGPWIDVDGDSTMLHGWQERQGAAIARMTAHADQMRAYRAQKKAERESSRANHVTVTCGLRNGLVQTSPDQTSPDQTSQEGDLPAPARDPSGASTEPEKVESDKDQRTAPPPNEHGKPSPMHLVTRFLAIRAEVLGVTPLFAQPQPSDCEKAAEWLGSMDASDCSDLEPAISLACKHVRDKAQGWTHPSASKVGFLFASIIRSWPDLREELHGCSPVISGEATGPPVNVTSLEMLEEVQREKAARRKRWGR